MTKKAEHRFPTLVRALLWLLATTAVIYLCVIGYVWIREREVATTVPSGDHYDAIIVLGAQVLPDGKPSVQLTWRLDAAFEAYSQKPVPVIVCGAQGTDEPISEAEAMKKYLSKCGIPEKQILMDPDSFNTKENLKNAGDQLKERQGIKKILIVTSDYHVPRALAIARDFGYEAIGLGSPCKPEYWIKNHTREALAWCKYWGIKYLHLPLE